jgi:putative DNA primase/helicase
MERGFAVFPLHYPVNQNGRLRCSCGKPECGNNAAKHPYAQHTPKGLLNASKDPAIIERWWGPGVPYNIGARTGEESGIVVIDVDPRHGGDARLSELEGRFGKLPKTWRFLTGGGGQHILFRHPGFRIKSTAGEDGLLGNGLDVRADGGYIVAPPSQHISGRHYAIDVDSHPDEVDLAELPVRLASILAAPADPNRHHVTELPKNWRRLVTEGVPEGRRNYAIARLTGLLLRPGPKDPRVVLELVRCWNLTRCRPPLDDKEVLRTVQSICARELARQEAAANA